MDFEREDDLMLEEAENTEEQTVEETVEGEVSAAEQETEPEAKTYTDEELNQRVDELLRPKIERAKVKAEKEARQQYEDYIALAEVVNAGIGTSDVKQAIASLTEFYEGKGIKIPARSKESYNEHDLNILAEHEAKQIIEAGYEDVVDETNRLAAKGVEHMSAKEKLIFSKLVEYNKAEKSRQDLLSIGAKSEIYAIINQLVADGKAVIIVSSEIPEVRSLIASNLDSLQNSLIQTHLQRMCTTSTRKPCRLKSQPLKRLALLKMEARNLKKNTTLLKRWTSLPIKSSLILKFSRG